MQPVQEYLSGALRESTPDKYSHKYPHKVPLYTQREEKMVGFLLARSPFDSRWWIAKVHVHPLTPSIPILPHPYKDFCLPLSPTIIILIYINHTHTHS